MDKITKENVIAAILSFFIPGLGQFLVQKRNRDAVWFFLFWLGSAILCVTLPITVVIWIWAVIDALFWINQETNSD